MALPGTSVATLLLAPGRLPQQKTPASVVAHDAVVPLAMATGAGAESRQQIGWVIVGCESGPRRRETSVEWVRAIRDDCVRAGVPFFLKQLYVDGKKTGLPELDGRTWAEVP